MAQLTTMIVPVDFAKIVYEDSLYLELLPTEFIEKYVMPMISGEYKLLCIQIGQML